MILLMHLAATCVGALMSVLWVFLPSGRLELVTSRFILAGMNRPTVELLMGHPWMTESHGPPGEFVTTCTYGPVSSSVCVTFDSHGKVLARNR